MKIVTLPLYTVPNLFVFLFISQMFSGMITLCTAFQKFRVDLKISFAQQRLIKNALKTVI